MLRVCDGRLFRVAMAFQQYSLKLHIFRKYNLTEAFLRVKIILIYLNTIKFLIIHHYYA